MDDILIPCPNCGKELRLRDPKLLGKTGKCPKCSHRFKLEEPEDEVELELAEIPVGTSAQWVPDGDPAAAPAVATPAVPASAAGIPAFATEEATPASLQRLRSTRKKPDKLKIAIISASVLSMIGVVVGIFAAVSQSPEKKGNGKSTDNSVVGNTDVDDQDPLLDGGDDENASYQQAVGDKPPAGKPIALNFIPTGARMVIHLRPAEIWKAGSDAETVRFCLGSLGIWTEQKLTEVLLFKPAEIEEATICLFLDDRNAPPEVAFRAKLVETHARSDFVEKFGGKLNTEHGRKVYETEETPEKPATAYMIIDRNGREYASAPKYRAKDMVNAEVNPGLAFGGIDQLLKSSDDRRHLTILFDPADLRNSKKFLFPDTAFDLLGHFLVWFEDSKMDSVAWSFHFGDKSYDKFHSEILLRNKSAISSRVLQNDMNNKLESLAEVLLGAVERMTPETVAQRKLVGRLPAMYQAFYVQTMQTSSGPNENWVRLTTVLPKVAGPNLAAGSLFAWRLARNTDFTKPAPKKPSKKIPELIADRLKLPVDVDFRRMPFQEAIAFIGEETHIRIEIDGDALKDSGYTKNMPQTMKLGSVSGVRVFSAILKQYPAMVISVDEKTKLLTVTTKKFAAMKGLIPFELSQ